MARAVIIKVCSRWACIDSGVQRIEVKLKTLCMLVGYLVIFVTDVIVAIIVDTSRKPLLEVELTTSYSENTESSATVACLQFRILICFSADEGLLLW